MKVQKEMLSSILREDITVLNMCVLTKKASKYVKQQVL